MGYATVEDVEKGFRALSEEERSKCEALLDEAAVIIGSCGSRADYDAKQIVACRMVRRAIGESDAQLIPMGASQGSMSAGGYSQSWTIGSGGSVGELYLNKQDKKLLGISDRMCTISPLEVGRCVHDQGY